MLGKNVIEAALSLYKLLKTTSWTILDQQVEFVLILKRLVELDDRWVVKVCENASLDKDLFNSTFV